MKGLFVGAVIGVVVGGGITMALDRPASVTAPNTPAGTPRAITSVPVKPKPTDIATDISSFVTSGSEDRARVIRAQRAASPALIEYEEMISKQMSARATAKSAVICKLRSDTWRTAVDRTSRNLIANGATAEKLRLAMSLDDVFAAEAYERYMTGFYQADADAADCSKLADLPFLNTLDLYAKGLVPTT